MLNIDLGGSVITSKEYYGTLQIHTLCAESGETLGIVSAPNVITYDARLILTYLLSGENRDNKYIKTLRVGTDATAETRNDSALGAQVDSVNVTYTFPDVDRVQFEGILPKVTASNGSVLTEAGLFNIDDQLFARQTYGSITKTSAIQLKYIWTIIFT